MSVYVDQLSVTVPNRNWRYRQACHLFANDIEELHVFARQLRMKRHWFQDRPGFPHYDLTATRRKVAVRLGALEITTREWIERQRIP